MSLPYLISDSAAYIGDDTRREGIMKGDYDVVYLCPEALSKKSLWREMISKPQYQDNMAALVIDDAHCISQWGKDFRQTYKNLGEIRSILPVGTPTLALTATATTKVRKDIQQSLGITKEDIKIIEGDVDRKKLCYHSIKAPEKMQDTFSWLLEEIKTHKQNSDKTIIYCRSVKAVSEIYQFLEMQLGEEGYMPGIKGVKTRTFAMFHRNTTQRLKRYILYTFSQDLHIRVVIATIAFGMGVDILDVRKVIHWGCPRTLESFAQESGRADRDGLPAISII